ncbi:hypothetical protein B0H34DRAFT_670296 [Crassisporium funariophilum]|nr:hypothetical protein B0H34DRAFT_670296 [Crassisporium funariophilum]
MSDEQHPLQNVLKYNIKWMKSTFNSRPTTEALLAPERESGNLNLHDYETAVDFLPAGYHRKYHMIGSALAGFGATALSVRKKWSLFKGGPIIVFAGMFGRLLGEAAEAAAHGRYLSSITNPDGYRRAMENIQQELGVTSPSRSLVISRLYTLSQEGDPMDQTQADYLRSTMTGPNSSPETKVISSDESSSQKPLSKWDQIRVANSRTASNSTWDSIRQQHERERVKPHSASAASSSDASNDKWDND